VEIVYEKGLTGHSDGDVVLHAVIDAMLGAAGLGDIGEQFPDSDPAYEGIDSCELLGQTHEKIEKAGYEVSNIDVTVIAQEPNAPYPSASCSSPPSSPKPNITWPMNPKASPVPGTSR